MALIFTETRVIDVIDSDDIISEHPEGLLLGYITIENGKAKFNNDVCSKLSVDSYTLHAIAQELEELSS